MADEEKKILIDDDWKTQAAEEKEKLAQTVGDPKAAVRMPEADFAGLIQFIAMQAIVGLGGMMGPGGQDIPPNLELAKHSIDQLGVLDAKTKGNLDAKEKALLDNTLHQLRMAYVEALRGPGPGV